MRRRCHICGGEINSKDKSAWMNGCNCHHRIAALEKKLQDWKDGSDVEADEGDIARAEVCKLEKKLAEVNLESANRQAKITIIEGTRKEGRKYTDGHIEQLRKNCLQMSGVIESKIKKIDALEKELSKAISAVNERNEIIAKHDKARAEWEERIDQQAEAIHVLKKKLAELKYNESEEARAWDDLRAYIREKFPQYSGSEHHPQEIIDRAAVELAEAESKIKRAVELALDEAEQCGKLKRELAGARAEAKHNLDSWPLTKEWTEQCKLLKDEVEYFEANNKSLRAVVEAARNLDVLKETEPLIVTNICDECGQAIYRDPTPGGVEKYKEPAGREVKVKIDRVGRSKPLPFTEDDEPRVRNPDGRIWKITSGSVPHLEDVSCSAGFPRCENMTPAEAFRPGALVRWTNPNNNDLYSQFYVTRGEFTDRRIISEHTLVKPAPEEKP